MGSIYFYNPYNFDDCRQLVQPKPLRPALHAKNLRGRVSFIAFPPNLDAYPVPHMDAPREELSRLFLGQLPYSVSDQQLAWLCDTIAPGTALFGIETIMKKTGMKGKRLPTGCIHALVHPSMVACLQECLSRRILFDDCGIWFAQNADEQAELQAYCDMMKRDERMRFRDHPYQTVVVQMATSTFTRTRPTSAPGTPPPEYARGACAAPLPLGDAL